MNKTISFLIVACLVLPGCFGGTSTDLPTGDAGDLPFEELKRPERSSFPTQSKGFVEDLSKASAECTQILKSNKLRAKEGEACLAGLSKVATASAPLAGGSFQFDQVLSELARLQDGVRILAWRLGALHEPKLIAEQRGQVETRLASLAKVLAPLLEAKTLDTVLENSLHADTQGLMKRFLEADRREIGLLYEKMSRGVFDQGTLPQNVRIATIEHYCRVFKSRILVRALRLIHPEKAPPDNANKDSNLQAIEAATASRWAAYASKGLAFIEASLSAAQAQAEKELSSTTVAENKKKVSAAYLDWTKHHEALLGR